METTKKNLLTDIEQIIALAQKHKLKDEFFVKAEGHLQAVASVLRITTVQATLLSLVLEMSDDEAVSVGAIAKDMKCSRIQILKYMDDFEALEKKRLIKTGRDRFSESKGTLPSYIVPVEVIKAIRAGRPYRGNEYRGLTPEGFFKIAQELLEARRDQDISEAVFTTEMSALFSAGAKTAYVKTIKELELPVRTAFQLTAFCCVWLDGVEENIPLSALRAMLRATEVNFMENSMQQGKHKLIAEGILVNGNDVGLADTETWTFTQKARETLLSELDLQKKTKIIGRNIIKADTIQERPMFYHDKAEARIGELAELLDEENFSSVRKRLAEQKVGAAFTILFQGPPGTGKTETAYQLARMTGRDICLVDISETKSQWFGESEKRIKAIFSRYRTLVNGGGTTPILLFNEADAVLGKRQELGDVRRGPAQTENAIQNIILQEMETLGGGILIATTNMVCNLDKAFERRFLYKIEFEKPDHKVKTQIWKSRLNGLEEQDAQTLSRRYDFSGGQIENIVRKQAINSILRDTPLTLDGLSALCDDEMLDVGTKPIGFRAH